MNKKSIHFLRRSVLQLAKIAINPSRYLLPKFLSRFADQEKYYIDYFIHSIPEGNLSKVLDAGAGNFRYRKTLEEKSYRYESQEFANSFNQENIDLYTYVCDIEALDISSKLFDLIICTQVLEHVPHPNKAIAELARVLKYDGRIYLTTNFLFPIHGEPFDFFRFTRFGLLKLFEEAGLEIISIEPRGGVAAFLGKIFFEFPSVIKAKLIFGDTTPHGPRKVKVKSYLLLLFSIPFIFVFDLLFTFLAVLIASLDFLDRKKRYTLGYQVIAQKSAEEIASQG